MHRVERSSAAPAVYCVDAESRVRDSADLPLHADQNPLVFPLYAAAPAALRQAICVTICRKHIEKDRDAPAPLFELFQFISAPVVQVDQIIKSGKVSLPLINTQAVTVIAV